MENDINRYIPRDNAVIRMDARRAINGRLWQYWQLYLANFVILAICGWIVDLIFGNPLNEINALLSGTATEVPKEINIMGVYAGYYTVNSLVSLLTVPFSFGILRYFLLDLRGIPCSKWQTFAMGFQSAKRYFKSLGMYLLRAILIALWSLLLIIPGVIKACSYAMTTFILYDEENLTVWQAMKLSENMMRGYKGKYVLLILSFFGWLLLGVLTFGILYIWVTPYMTMSTAVFYDEVRRSYYNEDPARVRETAPTFKPDDKPHPFDDEPRRSEKPFSDDDSLSGDADDSPFSDL